VGIQDRDYWRPGRANSFKRDPLLLRGPKGFALQVLGLIALFATGFILVARMLGWLGLMSFPWVQGGLWLYFGFIPVELVMLAPVALAFKACVFKHGRGRAVASVLTSACVILTITLTLTPTVWKVLTWRGPGGEFLQSRVNLKAEGWLPIDQSIGKADGSLVWLVNSEGAQDPTWSRLRSFLWNDSTDALLYRTDKRVCADFAETLHNRAESSGIRCGYVLLQFQNGERHASNVFDTSDRGRVFIDCTGSSESDSERKSCDRIVPLVKPGFSYKPEYIFDNQGFTWTSMGIVRTLQIQW